MGRMIEFIFQKVYLAMLASGIFLLLSFCGGLIFGVAPAGAVLMSLYAEHGSNYKAYHFQQAWNLFKDNFIQANQVFYSIAAVEALFIYGVYLLIQLPQSLFTIFLSLVNLIFALVLPLVYSVYLKLQVHFELSYVNSLKLSIIGIFLNISAMLKMLLGTALLLVASYYAPALGFFVFIGAWHFFISDVLKPVYELLKSKLIV